MDEDEMKLSLKIMVDTKAKKVVFAEAGKEFVDFLFNIISMPLSTVVELLNKGKMMGSLPALYKSVESLNPKYFDQFVDNDTVLQPKYPVDIPLLSVRHTEFTYNKCPVHKYSSIPGFVKEAVPFMVMDNLEVKPMSLTLIKSLVNDLDFIDEKEVEFGPYEGLALLRASLVTTDVLTIVFLKRG